jgi:phage gp36-like protein
MIIQYQKVTDETTTYRLNAPDGIELAEIDGITYVSLPDGAALPEQPEQIAASVSTVTLTEPLREAIKAASPHCQLISERVIERIRDRYTYDDELYFTRITIGQQMGLYQMTAAEVAEVQEFGAFVEAARQWGRDERAKLGL